MADYSINNISNNVDNYTSNISTNKSVNFYLYFVIDCTTLAIGLPVVLLAIYVMYHELKTNQPVHVFLINLLISDIFQFIVRLVNLVGKLKYSENFWVFFYIGIIASVVFMVSIAVERYLLIAHPHWYRFHSNKKCSVITSLVLWAFLVSFFTLGVVLTDISKALLTGILFVLLVIFFPLLLLLFLLTWRGLFKSSLAAKEKRRIMITIGLVNGNFIFCFFPLILVLFCLLFYRMNFAIFEITHALFNFSPLVDTVIFIFMRKSSRVFLAEILYCRTCRHHEDTNSTFSVSADVTSSLSTV